MTPSQSKKYVYSVLKRFRWRIVSYKCRSGSRYLIGMQGYKKVVIRIADHPPTWKANRGRIDYGIHPGGKVAEEFDKWFIKRYYQ